MRWFLRTWPGWIALIVITHVPAIRGAALQPFQCHDPDKAQGLCARLSPGCETDEPPEIALTAPAVDHIQFTCRHLHADSQVTILNMCCLTNYQLGDVQSGAFVPVTNATFSATCFPP
ncbi:hypothetical protein PCANC_21924 [Puccinia coronata f. sp. avenae]|uniref:Hydrophobin n=1 Tax=Puccinia coronata f. sp. avenae TaxID=200324 RepID=A0A2N5TU66_9BASI|nr:hypothetical protein PCANC_22881 [Puccinia coronata f. sp. avenae]PLW28539.1 hypothetical protein PCANC_21924 [Puccinia coronata f. sp. avenae]PLW28978.1 hypothetical protein PCASD_19461 [Puccinia coronata f. sp. avenae]